MGFPTFSPGHPTGDAVLSSQITSHDRLAQLGQIPGRTHEHSQRRPSKPLGLRFYGLDLGPPQRPRLRIARRPCRAGRWGDVGGFLTEENDRFAAMARSRVAPGVFAAAFRDALADPIDVALRRVRASRVGAFWASSRFWEGSSESAGNGSARAAPAKLCGSVSTRSDVRISAQRRASASSAASSASGGAGFRAGRCFFALVGLAAGCCVCIGVCVSTVTMVRVAAIDSVASSSIGGSGARAGSVASSTVGGGGSGARASSSTLSVAGEGSDDTKGCSGSTGWCRAGRGGDAGGDGSGLSARDGRRRVRHRGHERRELRRT